MQPQVTRLSPETRQMLRIGGILLILIGGVFVIAALVDFFAAANAEPFSSDSRPDKFWMAFVGLPLVMAGSALVRWGFLKPLSEIAATETAGAVEVAGGALGRGVRAGFGDVPGAQTLVKVKCRSCGYLESEDARFCSQCRNAL